MLALAGQPSLHGYDACRFIGQKGHFGEIAGKSTGSSGGWALRGLGSNAPKVLIRREFCGRGSIPAWTGSGCSLGKILQLWMTARACLSDEKTGSPPNGAVFEPVSIVFL